MRMTETYLKIAQDCGAQLVDMGNCPIPYGELPEPGAAAQVNFYSHYQLEDCIYKATDALQQQLEAAKQLSLGLLAISESIRSWLITNVGHSDTCEVHSDLPCSCGLSELTDETPPQALREHEAKVLEEAAAYFNSDDVDSWEIAGVLNDMAEERRKK